MCIGCMYAHIHGCTYPQMPVSCLKMAAMAGNLDVVKYMRETFGKETLPSSPQVGMCFCVHVCFHLEQNLILGRLSFRADFYLGQTFI